MINWSKVAEADLRKYPAVKDSLHNIQWRLEEIHSRRFSISSSADSVPVQGGGNKTEDRMLNLQIEEAELKRQYREALSFVRRVEKSLEHLDSVEREILTLFSTMRSSAAVECLISSTGYERAQIYRKRNEALAVFTNAMYGFNHS
ncbi:MAG: hypothetical protein J6X34_09610 [Clostridia bacterium]|nr:hypothetical protein [Clostridia bacterium]